ncbi:MAG: hypothetical protein AUG51_21475 [Acidobacteria bacterium 13_1_20CM_3_53_8]|nr:MAG: hypothetical protein AUG51_21475 [Acidobacteria bacterium 13_1_20CM_3_53_8]
MADNMTSAYIAAGVSLFIACLGLVGTWLQLQNARKRQASDIAHAFSEKIYEQRVKAYPEGYAILSKIRKLGPPHHLAHPDHMRDIKDKLNSWAATTSLFFSRDTAECYWELRKALAKNPAHGSEYSEQQADKVFLAKNRLRKQMRIDIGNLYASDANESADEHWAYL